MTPRLSTREKDVLSALRRLAWTLTKFVAAFLLFYGLVVLGMIL